MKWNVLLVLGMILTLVITLFANFIWIFILIPIGLTSIGGLFK